MGGDEERMQIAYGVVRDDVPTRITVVEDDGSDAQRVTGAQRGRSPVLPVWSPDGQKLAFVRYNQAGGPGAVQVHVVNADGSGERHLGEGTLPQWTPDGRFLVVERVRNRPQNSTLHVLSVDGRGERRLAVGSSPALSHDGSSVAFVRHTFRRRGDTWAVATSSLHTVSLDGRGTRLRSRIKGQGQFMQPSWLPDDSAIAVIQRQGGLGGPLVTISTSGSRRVVVPQVGETYDWSPTAEYVAYTHEGVLYIIRPDGTEVDAYGQSNAIDIEWSPDGKKVAFSVLEVVDTQTDFVGLYVIDLEEEEPVRRRFALADGFVAYLDWRPLPPEESG